MPDDAFAIRAMTEADVSFGMRLKDDAGWNQSPADWLRLIGADPEGVFVAEVKGKPAGTAATFAYGKRFGWVGMVLVAQEFRRRGIATRLVTRCVEHLRSRGVGTVKLDATPAGREVYLRLGFRDERRLARFEGTARAAPGAPAEGIAPMRPEDLAEVAEFDAPRFGAERRRLIGSLFDNAPEAAHVLRREGRVRGFIAGRRGTRAFQLGPCVASESDGARALFGAATAAVEGGRVFADVVVENAWARGAAVALGLAEQRPLTRMSLGPNLHPGDFRGTLLVTGPEFG